MPHLTLIKWDYRGNLSKTVSGTVTAHYCYDASGNRLRKIALKTGGIREERIYIGSYELYRKTINGTLDTERQTSFVSDDTKRIAIVDTRTIPTPLQVTIRYQYDNHLGSACLELDGSAQVISYEEYHPFGTTSYRAGRNTVETSLKRYKYVGKERDEETGLYYYGARYYAAWLCRFVSVDPLQFKYPHYTPFQYAGNKPISFIDLDGMEELANDKITKMTPRSVEANKPDTPSLRGFNHLYSGLKFASLKEYESYIDYKTLVSQKISTLENKLNNPKVNVDAIKSELNQYTPILQELKTIENNKDVVFRLRSGKNVTNKSGGGNNFYNVNNGEVDININTSDLTYNQLISHEFKHAYQFFENKLGYGIGLGEFVYDFWDEKEAYDRSNLFSTTEANFFTADEIFDRYDLPYSKENITVDNYIETVYLGNENKLKEENKYWLSKNKFQMLRIYHGWNKD